MNDNTLRWRSLVPFVVAAVALLVFVLLAGDAHASWSGNSISVPGSANALTEDVAIDPSTGLVHVIWVNNASYHYFYTICDPSPNPPTCQSAVDLGGGTSAPTLDDQGSTAQALRPSISIAPNGDVYVGFGNPAYGVSKTAVYRKKPSGSSSFNPIVSLGAGWAAQVAADAGSNLDVVWSLGGNLNFKKFNAAGAVVVPTTSIATGGYNPKIITDSADNAHVAWETGVTPREVEYREILANGTPQSTFDVSNNGTNSTNLMLAVDSSDQLHLAWQDVGVIHYRLCSTPISSISASCTATTTKSGADNGSDPSITVIGSTPFIAYYKIVNSVRSIVVYSGNTDTRQQVDTVGNEWFPVIRGGGDGRLHLVYRLGTTGLRYWIQASGVIAQTSTPTATGTSTDTPTPTSTSSVTPPTATETNTPTDTLTPTVTRTPVPNTTPINLSNNASPDKLPSITINGSGDIVVAWEKDVSTTKKDVYASIAPGGGSFNAPVNVTNSTPRSLQPALFNVTPSDVYAVYQEGAQLAYSILSTGSWSSINTLTTSGDSAKTAAGVQASDGKKWVTSIVVTSVLKDAWAIQIGAFQHRLSTSGAAFNPSIAAGDSGKVFFSWLDKGPSGTLSQIKVTQWTGSSWSALPDASSTGTQPTIAYANGKLYAVWLASKTIKQRIWDGSAWGAVTSVGTGSAPKTPKVFVPASGNVFVVWSDQGKIYLAENSGTKRAVSGTVASSVNPAIYVDSGDIPYIVWGNGEIWFVANP